MLENVDLPSDRTRRQSNDLCSSSARRVPVAPARGVTGKMTDKQDELKNLALRMRGEVITLSLKTYYTHRYTCTFSAHSATVGCGGYIIVITSYRQI